MRRRRMIVALALMVVIGSWMTWRITRARSAAGREMAVYAGSGGDAG